MWWNECFCAFAVVWDRMKDRYVNKLKGTGVFEEGRLDRGGYGVLLGGTSSAVHDMFNGGLIQCP